MDNTGLIFAALPLLITLLGVVWKMSSLAATLTEAVKAHKDDFAELREKLSRLDAIPIMERDLRQLQESHMKLVSEFPKLDKRVLRAEWKLGLSVTGMRPPSQHEIQVFEEEAKKK